MKSSRYYQNHLQVASRLSATTLYICGWFVIQENFWISFISLLISLYGGYKISHYRFMRQKATKNEIDSGLEVNLRSAIFYQRLVQFTGRGRDSLFFFAALFLKEYPGYSLLLFFFQILFGILNTELMYYRERSTYHGK